MEATYRDLRDYYPLVIRDVREFQALAVSENPEIQAIWLCLESVLKNQFVMTADEDGIALFERQLKITSAGTATLEERRFQVLVALNESTPYTERRLREMLNAICGEKEYRLEINRNAFLVEVKVELTSKRNKNATAEMLERVLPANMIFHVDLLYNQHQTLAPYTHEGLRMFTQYHLRNEVLN